MILRIDQLKSSFVLFLVGINYSMHNIAMDVCSEHLKHLGHLGSRLRQGLACRILVSVCPWEQRGRKAEASGLGRSLRHSVFLTSLPREVC